MPPPLCLQIVEATPVDSHTILLLAEEYSTSGRVDHLTQVMALHPHYLESFLRSQFYLLRMDGPLPLHYRHYIAIMVSRAAHVRHCLHKLQKAYRKLLK